MQKYTYVFKRKNSHDLLLKKYILDSPFIFKNHYYIGAALQDLLYASRFFLRGRAIGRHFCGDFASNEQKKTTCFTQVVFFCGCQDSNLEPFGS